MTVSHSSRFLCLTNQGCLRYREGTTPEAPNLQLEKVRTSNPKLKRAGLVARFKQLHNLPFPIFSNGKAGPTSSAVRALSADIQKFPVGPGSSSPFTIPSLPSLDKPGIHIGYDFASCASVYLYVDISRCTYMLLYPRHLETDRDAEMPRP